MLSGAVIFAALAGITGSAMYAFYSLRREQGEKEADYIALLPMANDLRERAIRYKKLQEKITLLENNGTEKVAGVSLSWDNPSSTDGKIRIDIPDGEEVTEELLRGLMGQTEEQLEDTVLYILKWYRDNIGDFPPLPRDDYQRRYRFKRRPQNVRETIPTPAQKGGGEARQSNLDADTELYRFAWRRKRESRWHIEGYHDDMSAAERQVELVMSMGNELEEYTRVVKATADRFNILLERGLAE